MANSVVFGVCNTKAQVETAVDEMKREGFRNSDISVLFPFNEGTKDFAFEKGTKTSEGAAAGATSGAVIGGALGWPAGLGVLAIPGLGPFIAAGPIMTSRFLHSSFIRSSAISPPTLQGVPLHSKGPILSNCLSQT